MVLAASRRGLAFQRSRAGGGDRLLALVGLGAVALTLDRRCSPWGIAAGMRRRLIPALSQLAVSSAWR